MQMMIKATTTELKRVISPVLGTKPVRLLRGVPLNKLNARETSEEILNLLKLKAPFSVGRIGESEGAALAFYLKYRQGRSVAPYPKKVLDRLTHMSGFFPAINEMVDAFCIQYTEYIKNLDVYAVWTRHDGVFAKFSTKKTTKLKYLEPFYAPRPWTLGLEGMRVLVISPFTEEILSQYERKDKLFPYAVLPDFELDVFSPPQTQNREASGYNSWQEALSESLGRRREKDFDVAIIGAGAYGPALANQVLCMQKSAIVLGGSTQLLFGIFGARWENQSPYKNLKNEYWVRPNENSRPQNYREMERGAYW